MLDDLRERLSKVRWPDEPPLEPWSSGTSVAYLKQLVAYWRDQFDWRAQEAKLNAFQQLQGGVGRHRSALHSRAGHAAPRRCRCCSRTAGPARSFEFHKIIPMLTDPARFGADPADAFTVVAPSLPGYAFSFRPGQPRFAVEQIADCVRAAHDARYWDIKRFAAQGGDWGAFVTSRLGLQYADRLYGIHSTCWRCGAIPRCCANPSPEEQVFLRQLEHWIKEEMGYQWIQGTKPQTLAFGLTDSPVGLAAWLMEKFRNVERLRRRSGIGIQQGRAADEHQLVLGHGRDRLVVLAVLRPHARSVADPARARACRRRPATWNFPAEMLRPPRSVAEKVYNIQRWSKRDKGGHFAALEQPQALAEEMRAFFRPLRG